MNIYYVKPALPNGTNVMPSIRGMKELGISINLKEEIKREQPVQIKLFWGKISRTEYLVTKIGQFLCKNYKV